MRPGAQFEDSMAAGAVSIRPSRHPPFLPPGVNPPAAQRFVPAGALSPVASPSVPAARCQPTRRATLRPRRCGASARRITLRSCHPVSIRPSRNASPLLARRFRPPRNLPFLPVRRSRPPRNAPSPPARRSRPPRNASPLPARRFRPPPAPGRPAMGVAARCQSTRRATLRSRRCAFARRRATEGSRPDGAVSGEMRKRR